MEPRPLNTKIVNVYVFVNHLPECCPIMETKELITITQMCPLNQLRAPRHDGRDGKINGPGPET